MKRARHAGRRTWLRAEPRPDPARHRRHQPPAPRSHVRGSRSLPLTVATVYRGNFYQTFAPRAMNTVRWLRISEALARRGYAVDLVMNTGTTPVSRLPNLRYVPLTGIDWRSYDVVKTLFHKGFMSLVETGGADHPFIISKLGSVVGCADSTEGVYFHGEIRAQLYETQRRIHDRSRFVTVLTDASRQLWRDEFGGDQPLLHVPTGVDAEIPPPTRNPYRGFDEKVAVYIGNIYNSEQKDVNVLWQRKLNALGGLLKQRGMRLCFVGEGDVDLLDPAVVTNLGPVEHSASWDYQYFADVGLVFAQGTVQHNESSKIYYYLRTGLPVVSEEPVPNNHVLHEAGLGLVAAYDDLSALAELAEEAARREWPREDAIRYVLKHHTWDRRAEIYDSLLRKEFALSEEATA